MPVYSKLLQTSRLHSGRTPPQEQALKRILSFCITQWGTRSSYGRGWEDVSLPYEPRISEGERKKTKSNGEEGKRQKNQPSTVSMRCKAKAPLFSPLVFYCQSVNMPKELRVTSYPSRPSHLDFSITEIIFLSNVINLPQDSILHVLVDSSTPTKVASTVVMIIYLWLAAILHGMLQLASLSDKMLSERTPFSLKTGSQKSTFLPFFSPLPHTHTHTQKISIYHCRKEIFLHSTCPPLAKTG